MDCHGTRSIPSSLRRPSGLGGTTTLMIRKTTSFLFPGLKPGEVPKVPAEFFKPRDEEKAKIKAFIDRHEGEDVPWLREFVVLAKELVKEVH